MFTQINLTEVPDQQPETTVESFFNITKNETVTIYAKSSSEECIKADLSVSTVKKSQNEQDDIIYGTINNDSSKLRLPWRPAEPTVGIPKPYYEPPVQLEYDNVMYDVIVIN